MKIKVYFIAIALFTLRSAAQAQQAEKAPAALQLGSFNAQYSYSPLTINGNRVDIQQAGAAINLPVIYTFKDNKLDFLLAGVEYDGLFLSGVGNRFGGTRFSSISVPLTFQKSFSPKYALIASFIPTLSSDLKDLSGDDMLYSAAVMMRITKSEKFSYSLGAAYSRQFFGNVLIPVIGVDWNISGHWSLSGTLPISEKLKYTTGKSAIGVSNDFSIGGGSYRLSKQMDSRYFQLQQIRSSLFYEYAFAKNFSMQVSAGYNFSQKLDLYNKDQKVGLVPFNDLNKRIPLTEIDKTGIAIQSGINYRF